MRDNKELFEAVDQLHVWADNAGQYHGAGWLHHLMGNFQDMYGVRASMQFGPPGENKEEVSLHASRIQCVDQHGCDALIGAGRRDVRASV